jgi:hypothetical protein
MRERGGYIFLRRGRGEPFRLGSITGLMSPNEGMVICSRDIEKGIY